MKFGKYSFKNDVVVCAHRLYDTSSWAEVGRNGGRI